ncbi:MAG: D-alanyl-D-alanine carboxypeptidase family protein [Legionellaceae bacterium]|nr:D-alanyl-D-alanine carboxypeptidase family protein [Legionellaceae bacterium]
MSKCQFSVTKIILFVYFSIHSSFFYANSISGLESAQPVATSNNPLITPAPPPLNAKAFILVDVDSGKIIAEKNSEERLPPASLTKMMTLYVVSNALNNNQIHLTDNVRVSQEAWKIGGSRMFVKEGQQVAVEDLLKGIIVDSGNDACVALAEHLGSSEAGFTELMNNQAKNLGMNSSHFTDSTGLPDPNHYTTAKDLAILGQALIKNFPQYYHWYKQKWFTFNGIRQPNRNRLLWRDNQVDGIKTGHTNEAGFCLVSSAKRGDMRLLAVVLNAPTDTTRADDSERLLNYGFRFFETHELYKANQPISKVRLYKGKTNEINVGVLKNDYVTIPSGQYQRLTINTKIPKFIEAPIQRGQKVGELVIQFDGKVLEVQPLYALQNEEAGGFYVRVKDSVRMMFAKWFG